LVLMEYGFPQQGAYADLVVGERELQEARDR
jgi:hypothetical protein